MVTRTGPPEPRFRSFEHARAVVRGWYIKNESLPKLYKNKRYVFDLVDLGCGIYVVTKDNLVLTRSTSYIGAVEEAMHMEFDD